MLQGSSKSNKSNGKALSEILALAALSNIFDLCLQILDFGRTWQLGATGGMENGPSGFGCELLVILQIFEKSIKIEKC